MVSRKTRCITSEEIQFAERHFPTTKGIGGVDQNTQPMEKEYEMKINEGVHD